MKVHFGWKDPEYTIGVVRDDGSYLEDWEAEEKIPNWEDITDQARDVVSKYCSGEYITLMVDMETNEVFIGKNKIRLVAGESDDN